MQRSATDLMLSPIRISLISGQKQIGHLFFLRDPTTSKKRAFYQPTHWSNKVNFVKKRVNPDKIKSQDWLTVDFCENQERESFQMITLNAESISEKMHEENRD